jgi:hypothetical protein
MGYFDDGPGEVSEGKGGQRRHVHPALEARDQEDLRRGSEEVALSKINEVLDIKKDRSSTSPKLRRTSRRSKTSTSRRGFYMAGGDVRACGAKHLGT